MKKLMITVTCAMSIMMAFTGCNTENTSCNNGKCTVASPVGSKSVSSESRWYVIERRTNQYVVFSWLDDNDGNHMSILAKRVGWNNTNAVPYTRVELNEFLGEVTNQDVDKMFRFSGICYQNGCLMIIEKSFKELNFCKESNDKEIAKL